MRDELRIGNLVRTSIYYDTDEAKEDLGEDYSEDKEWIIDTVQGICHPDEEFMYWGESEVEESTNRTEGIPLTDAWLEYFGAERYEDKYFYDRFKLIWKKAYKYWYIIDKESLTYLSKVEFVHEWQNFVYVMNGFELKKREEKIKERASTP